MNRHKNAKEKTQMVEVLDLNESIRKINKTKRHTDTAKEKAPSRPSARQKKSK
jgi:hypothetical protein